MINEKSILEGRVMSFIKELWTFMRVRKKFWLLPIFLIMALFGALIVMSQGSAVAILSINYSRK